MTSGLVLCWLVAWRRQPAAEAECTAEPDVVCSAVLCCAAHLRPSSGPQPQTDIFNNLNLSFWEYMLPGTDAYR